MNPRAIGTRGLIVILIAGIIAILLPSVSLAQQIQAGQAALGGGSSGENIYNITFPIAFSSTPKVSVTIQTDPPSAGDAGIWAATVHAVTTTSFTVNVIFISQVFGNPWSQNLRLNWIAWE